MNGPLGLPGFPAGLPPFLPGGYLTLVSGTPLATSDQSAKVVVYYTQDTHNAFPIIKNGTRQAIYFDEPRLVLSAAHLASSIYDVFGVERNGKGHLVTGPAWATVTAGSGARGVTGSTTELARMGGMLVNRWPIVGLNGDGSQFVQPYEGTYLGSIFMDGTNGQISCLPAYGQSRKWGLWNCYQRRPIHVKCGDPNATWNYTTNTFRASRADATNVLSVFCGLADETIDLQFTQRVNIGNLGSAATSTAENAIGWNSSTASSGKVGFAGITNAAASATTPIHDMKAHFIQVGSLGRNDVTALERSSSTSTTSWVGTEAGMLLSARWRG